VSSTEAPPKIVPTDVAAAAAAVEPSPRTPRGVNPSKGVSLTAAAAAHLGVNRGRRASSSAALASASALALDAASMSSSSPLSHPGSLVRALSGDRGSTPQNETGSRPDSSKNARYRYANVFSTFTPLAPPAMASLSRPPVAVESTVTLRFSPDSASDTTECDLLRELVAGTRAGASSPPTLPPAPSCDCSSSDCSALNTVPPSENARRISRREKRRRMGRACKEGDGGAGGVLATVEEEGSGFKRCRCSRRCAF